VRNPPARGDHVITPSPAQCIDTGTRLSRINRINTQRGHPEKNPQSSAQHNNKRLFTVYLANSCNAIMLHKNKITSAAITKYTQRQYKACTPNYFPRFNLARPAAERLVGYMFCFCFLYIYFLTIPVRPIISKSAGPIFAKFFGFGRTMAVNDQSKISFSIP